jgi:hypothetical protein
MERTQSEAAERAFEDGIVKAKSLAEYRWEVQFIFGTDNYTLLNRVNKAHKELPLHATATEENFRELFKAICEAVVKNGYVKEGDKIVCTTFPEGSTRVYPKGKA